MSDITAARIFGNAAARSWSLAREHTKATAIGGAILIAVGPLYSWFFGWEAMKSEVLNFALLSAGPLFGFIGLFYLCNLWLAPYRLIKHDTDQTVEALARRLTKTEGKIDLVFEKALEFRDGAETFKANAADDAAAFKAEMNERLADHLSQVRVVQSEKEVQITQQSTERFYEMRDRAESAFKETLEEIDRRIIEVRMENSAVSDTVDNGFASIDNIIKEARKELHEMETRVYEAISEFTRQHEVK